MAIIFFVNVIIIIIPYFVQCAVCHHAAINQLDNAIILNSRQSGVYFYCTVIKLYQRAHTLSKNKTRRDR